MIYEMLVNPHTFQNSAPNLNEEEIFIINATVGNGSTASSSAPEEAELKARREARRAEMMRQMRADKAAGPWKESERSVGSMGTLDACQ
jgi:hypothetical protein